MFPGKLLCRISISQIMFQEEINSKIVKLRKVNNIFSKRGEKRQKMFLYCYTKFRNLTKDIVIKKKKNTYHNFT